MTPQLELFTARDQRARGGNVERTEEPSTGILTPELLRGLELSEPFGGIEILAQRIRMGHPEGSLVEVSRAANGGPVRVDVRTPDGMHIQRAIAVKPRTP